MKNLCLKGGGHVHYEKIQCYPKELKVVQVEQSNSHNEKNLLIKLKLIFYTRKIHH